MNAYSKSANAVIDRVAGGNLVRTPTPKKGRSPSFGKLDTRHETSADINIDFGETGFNDPLFKNPKKDR